MSNDQPSIEQLQNELALLDLKIRESRIQRLRIALQIAEQTHAIERRLMAEIEQTWQRSKVDPVIDDNIEILEAKLGIQD